MFQFRRFPTYTYGFSVCYMDMTPCGFPHSEICGSKIVCISPQLFAAYHVFLRLPVPRHSPCALCSLTMLESWFSFGYCSFYYPIPRIISLLSLQIFVSIVQFSRCVSEPFRVPLVEMRRIELLTPCVQGRCSPS